MAGQVGRISGGVLQDNLVRNGVDLNFKNETLDTALLQLKVNTARIGVNTESPASDLEVAGTIAGNTLLQDTYLTVANFTIQNSEINVAPGNMYLNAANQIQLSSLSTDNIKIDFNTVSTTTPNTNLEIRPDGTGTLDIHANTNVTGSLHATGNITFGGNLTLGNDDTDSVDFNADVNSHLIPDSTDSYDLGSGAKHWRTMYAGSIEGNLLAANVVVVEDTSLAQRQGNIFYVAVNGDDTNVGDHPNGPFRTIAHALAVADGSTAGPTTIHIYPGEYEETTPLVVPQNTTITGEDIRNTIVRPNTASQGEDIFHLNQNTLVENITVRDFTFDSGNNTGYAFRFASGAIINERSPYVRNVSVITAEIPATSTPTNITVGPAPTLFSFSSNSVTVDKTFYSQPLIDSLVGKIAVIDRYPSAPLIYTVLSVETEPTNSALWRINFDSTFDLTGQLKPISFYSEIPPETIITNDIWDTTGNSIGEKWVAWYKTNLPSGFETTVESGWSINLAGQIWIVDYVIEDPMNTNMWRVYVTTSLAAGVGIPVLTPPTITPAIPAGHGAWIDGSELNSVSTQASMLFHSATFITPSVDCITMLNGVRVEWLNSFTYFANRGLYALQGSAGFANLGTVFGAEIRSIGSACVYGNYGAVADGADTLMYLIGHNFAYIGAGTDSSNDTTLTLRDQEAVELNSGKIYYVSTDARGTFRVGNIFYVDFDTGETSINANNIDFSGVSAIVINTGGEITYIDGERIDIGNIRISGNTIRTLSGDLIWSPAGYLNVSSNSNIILPRGTTTQRISEQSDIRYNTSTSLFEGFSSANVAFNGVFSDNRNTRVRSIDPSSVSFTVNNIQTGRLVPGMMQFIGATTGDILIDGNLITTNVSNSNLELSPDGLGRVYFDDLTFIDNVVDNVSNNNLTVANTGQGYLKFDNVRGMVVPTGTDAERPLTPPQGTTRWNTDRDYLETWNGVEWQRAAGEGETVTAEIMGEILDIYTLVLG